jgi:hypothetical protein
MTDLAQHQHNPRLIHLLHGHSPKISKPEETRDAWEICNSEIVSGVIFDANKPIAENKAATSQKPLSDYTTSATTPTCDDTQPHPHNTGNVNVVSENCTTSTDANCPNDTIPWCGHQSYDVSAEVLLVPPGSYHSLLRISAEVLLEVNPLTCS